MFSNKFFIMEKNQTKGHQKIEMRRIPNEENHLITFLEHRSGSTKRQVSFLLCVAKVGTLVFSLVDKAFSFGHPSIETSTNKVLYENPPPNDGTLNLVQAYRQFRFNKLHKKDSELLSKMEVPKEQEKILRKNVPNQSKCWWEEPISELEQMATKIQMLHNHVQHQANELRTRASSSSLPFSVVNQTPPTNSFSMTKVE